MGQYLLRPLASVECVPPLTWPDPGCAVDVPGFTYSFSFAPNPHFTRLFPPQEEILEYLSTVAIQYGVDRHFTGHTEWTGAVWQEKKRTWLVTLQDLNTGQSFTQECQVLVSAVGGIVNPQELKIPGVEDFRGQIIHTARWRHDVDLTNKHVAVIGNGGMLDSFKLSIRVLTSSASSIQLIPAIADQAKSITQFMRVCSPPSPEPVNHLMLPDTASHCSSQQLQYLPNLESCLPPSSYSPLRLPPFHATLHGDRLLPIPKHPKRQGSPPGVRKSKSRIRSKHSTWYYPLPSHNSRLQI